MAQAIVTSVIRKRKGVVPKASAMCYAGDIEIPYNDEYDLEGNHREAVAALLDDLGWKGGLWVGGALRGKYGESKVAFVKVPGAPGWPDGETRINYSKGLKGILDDEPEANEDDNIFA